MHPDTFSAFLALAIYLGLNLACVFGLRACFSATFKRYGLPAVARGYGYMIVFCIVAAGARASEVTNIIGDVIALLLLLLPLASTVVLLACLLCAWRGWLTFPILTAALLLSMGVYMCLIRGMAFPSYGAAFIGASMAFAFGFKHGERPASVFTAKITTAADTP